MTTVVAALRRSTAVVWFAGAIAIFAGFLLVKGANPAQVAADIWSSTLTNRLALGEVLIVATPILLAGLAVAVPARAGLINVGGEGQLVMGAVAAAGLGLALDGHLPGPAVILVMAIGSMVGGGAWGLAAGALRQTLKVNEAISTLLLNYVAVDLLLFLIYDSWKDAAGFGQPATRPLASGAHLPIILQPRVHAGVIVGLIAALALGLALGRTRWGFKLRVAGGNPEAARRAGLAVGSLTMSAMLLGGALAGLGGMLHFAGAEFQLRQGVASGLGYVGFLASWLVGHRPQRVVVGSLLLATLIVAGDSLQIDANLPAASVNILIALVLLAALAQHRRAKGASTAKPAPAPDPTPDPPKAAVA